jgi:hypothetical protein
MIDIDDNIVSYPGTGYGGKQTVLVSNSPYQYSSDLFYGNSSYNSLKI